MASNSTPNVQLGRQTAVNRRLTNRAATQPRRGLDHDEAATYVGVSLAVFDRMVTDGRLPQPGDLEASWCGTSSSSTGRWIA